jgi:hypothetical protein
VCCVLKLNKEKYLIMKLTIIFYFITSIIYVKYSNSSSSQQECQNLKQPEFGYFIGGICSNKLGSFCGIRCLNGYKVNIYILNLNYLKHLF